VAWSLFQRQRSSGRDEIESRNPHPYRENKWWVQCDQGVTRGEPQTSHAVSRGLNQETLWVVLKHGGGNDRSSRTGFGVASKCGDLQDGYITSEVLVSPKTSRYYFLKKRFLKNRTQLWRCSSYIFSVIYICIHIPFIVTVLIVPFSSTLPSSFPLILLVTFQYSKRNNCASLLWQGYVSEMLTWLVVGDVFIL
jgi:hypothetical protein